MTSFREDLESRAQTILLGATLAGTAVDTDRDVPVDVKNLPAITLYTWDDSAELKSDSGTEPTYWTTLDLVIVARVAGPVISTARQLLKQLVDQIREALMCDPRLRVRSDGQVDVIRIPRLSTKLKLQGASETHIGEAELTFSILYQDIFPQTGATPLTSIVTTVTPLVAAPPISEPTAQPVPFTVTIPIPQEA